MNLSRVEKGIICGVTLAGLGVLSTAALAEHLGVRKKEKKEQKKDTGLSAMASTLDWQLELPTLPASKEEFLLMWASSYEHVKVPLSNVFQIVGQTLVAPIVMTAVDACYAKYLEAVRSRCDSRVATG